MLWLGTELLSVALSPQPATPAHITTAAAITKKLEIRANRAGTIRCIMGGTAPAWFNQAGLDNRLRAWLRLFWRYPSPRVISAALVVTASARIYLGGWRWVDLIVGGAFLLAQPFTEWILHVFVLHFRPRNVVGRNFDLYVARKHRAHHRDPVDIGLTFVQIPALLGLVVIVLGVSMLGFRDLRLALTASLTAYSLLLIYEWMHYLIHSTYVPRTRLYRVIYRAHRLHHYKSEHYWFGVTNPIADIVLRTYPDKGKVPTSPTARTLGQEV